MEYDLERALAAAWREVGPVLKGDLDEYRARVARRRLGSMSRPARAWCLGVRACDRRITGMRFPMVPDRPVWWDGEKHRWVRVEHEVVLERRNLAWLCRPVELPRGGVEAGEAAKMLGVARVRVWHAWRKGWLKVRWVKGFGGKWGHPVPIVSADRPLDPAGIPVGKMAEVEWGTMGRYVSDHLPEGFCQTLVRRPVYGLGVGRFAGWKWVCPGCRKEVSRIYCPVPGIAEKFRAKFAKDLDGESADAVQWPAATFACWGCHRVENCARAGWRDWDQLVSRLSGGLLYGHEVERPKWWVERKKAYWERPGARTGKRRAQLEGLLAGTDLKRVEIARRMGVSMGAIAGWIGYLYKRYGVKTREEFRKKLRGEEGTMKAAG